MKLAWASVLTTISTSLGSLLSIIPDNIGKLGVILTCILTVLLIRVQLSNYRNNKLECKIKKLELKKLQAEFDEQG